MVIYEKSLRKLIIPDGLEGYTQADIDAAFQSGYTEGNADGYTDGYADGLDDGAEEQKSLLEPITITENGTYEREDGYSSILVNVASGETINNQVKSSNLTVNGTYIVTYDSGYTGLQRVDIAVNVPQTGYTQADIDAAYQSGLTVGYDSGYTAGLNDCPECDCDNAYNSGYTSGYTDGYASGYTDGTAAKYINAPNTLNFDLSGDTKQIIIGSNTDWNITTSDNWITVTPTSGSGNGTIEITVESGTTERNSSIVITSVEGQITKTIVVNQKNMLYVNMPLTFEMLSDGNIQFNPNDDNRKYNKSWSYRINGGDWIEYTNEWIAIPVVTGDIIQFRGENITLGNGNLQHSGFYGSTGTFNVFGNIMSLYTKTDFENIISYAEGNTFDTLFSGCKGLTDARNLILPITSCTQFCYEYMFQGCTSLVNAPALPATTLGYHSYYMMFAGCTSLTSAPVLPATTLMERCYESMFNGCTNLNYIKCLATDISANYCTSYWMFGVASTGTFVKNPNMSNWPSGNDGIPVGWTIQDAS